MAKRTSMRTIAVRNIVSHKLRLALTVLSVMLGTAFISGAFMFTNSLSSTFAAAVGSAYEDVDAAVSPAEVSQEQKVMRCDRCLCYVVC